MEASRKFNHVCGTVIAVNTRQLGLTIRRLLHTLGFKVARTARIVTPTRPAAKLHDLQIGDWVEIFYEKCADHRLAHHIVRSDS